MTRRLRIGDVKSSIASPNYFCFGVVAAWQDTPRQCDKGSWLFNAHMGRFRSRGEVQSHIIRLRRLFRYPRSEPIARSGRFLARSNSHSVAVRDGYTNIPLAAVGAQEDETILFNGFSSHALKRFVHPDPPELIRSWKI